MRRKNSGGFNLAQHLQIHCLPARAGMVWSSAVQKGTFFNFRFFKKVKTYELSIINSDSK